jgi:ABC-type transport system involved in cytochrome c biogenesis permease subunit
VIEFHQAAAAVYLAAGIGALLGIVLPSARIARGAVWGLALGALLQGLCFATLHRLNPAPSLTDLPVVLALVVWMAVVCLLLFLWRMRVGSLVVVVGILAFLILFSVSIRPIDVAPPLVSTAGAWPHAHVLLSTAGLALLSVAGLAGFFFLLEHRRLKAKRGLGHWLSLPSLEALDRINVVSLVVGFPLLSLGVVTGIVWVQTAKGVLWTASTHETWTIVAWAIYAGLVAARFFGRQGSRQAAASAVAGFAFLAFAVLGVGLVQ